MFQIICHDLASNSKKRKGKIIELGVEVMEEPEQSCFRLVYVA